MESDVSETVVALSALSVHKFFDRAKTDFSSMEKRFIPIAFYSLGLSPQRKISGVQHQPVWKLTPCWHCVLRHFLHFLFIVFLNAWTAPSNTGRPTQNFLNAWTAPSNTGRPTRNSLSWKWWIGSSSPIRINCELRYFIF